MSGTLRGVDPEQAAWRPAAGRHSIWELVLHLAYWKYAVRRIIDDLPKGGFPRSPSNWPDQPAEPSLADWKKDRTLLKTEHDLLVESIDGFDPRTLDRIADNSKSYRFVDLMFGIVTHDVYHVGQIQILKRLYRDA